MSIMRKRKLHTCLTILLLLSLLGTSACGNKKETTTEDESTNQNEVVSDEDMNQGGEITTEEESVDALRDGISQLIQFTTDNNYHSYFTVQVELPTGVTASDITEITLGVDTKMPLELRLYAGSEEVTCEEATELTCEVTELKDTITGTETVEEDGESVEKQIHSITNEVISSTRLMVTEGVGQELTFAVDDHAKEVLEQLGNTLVLAVYAHDIAPSYGVYQVSVKTASDTIHVDFTQDNVKGVDGGFVDIIK